MGEQSLKGGEVFTSGDQCDKLRGEDIITMIPVPGLPHISFYVLDSIVASSISMF